MVPTTRQDAWLWGSDSFEVVFDTFRDFQNGTQATLRTCSHSAFEEPEAPADAAVRQSCEYRVGVFFLK